VEDWDQLEAIYHHILYRQMAWIEVRLRDLRLQV
jgi:hypothetical protein